MILLTDTARGKRPLVGAYFTGEDWVPCSWLSNGEYIGEQQVALDIVDYQ